MSTEPGTNRTLAGFAAIAVVGLMAWDVYSRFAKVTSSHWTFMLPALAWWLFLGLLLADSLSVLIRGRRLGRYQRLYLVVGAVGALLAAVIAAFGVRQ